MQIDFDWPQIYNALVTQNSRAPKSAFNAARQIEIDIFDEGWPAGEVFGDQAHLINRYGFSRATLREAVCLLEDRHVARMRRGPGGGLMILSVDRAAITPAVAAYFHETGITADQVRDARCALRIMDAHLAASSDGPATLQAFTDDFHRRIGPTQGGGLLDPCRWNDFCFDGRGNRHVFSAMFAACLDALEQRADMQPDDAPVPHNQQSLAHSLARKLMVELRAVRTDDMRRVGTEEQLCERHGVGRDVLRQAIRVLESHGLIDSQRGRTHGLHPCAPDSTALVELVVAHLSSMRLQWSELEDVAQILSRILRLVVAAESTARQRQELVHRLERRDAGESSPSIVAAQLHSEWAIADNPFLTFMERCAVAYCARSSAAIWRGFDDSEMTLKHLQLYMVTSARGDLVASDRIVDGICRRVRALRTQRLSHN